MSSGIYEDIAQRTGGDIYIGVVGPVRTGKSTFIKRFMETLVIPSIENVYARDRAKDELPQSGSGRTIMTAEPKFVPEEAVNVTMEDGAGFSVRLIDCVGFMVPGAAGQFENGAERMVTTPWFDKEIPMSRAAELGTEKVIREHSTIGLVITTDGSICEIPRSDYIEAEERTVNELKAIGKPFILLINSAQPDSPGAQALRAELEQKYGVSCVCVNCLELTQQDITDIIRSVLYEFPVTELGIYLPSWVDALPPDSEIRGGLYSLIMASAGGMQTIRDVSRVCESLGEGEMVSSSRVRSLSLGDGIAAVTVDIPRALYYSTLTAQCGFEIRDDGDLMSLLSEMSVIKKRYDRLEGALRDAEETGYGIVIPSVEEMTMQEPEIVRQGGKYGVRLKASAPSLHIIKTTIETEVSPAIGGEKASEEIVGFLLQGYEGDVNRIWESNIFGKSLYDIAGEGLTTKIRSMPQDAQAKLQEALQRIVNEGSGGLICIIL